MFLFVLYTSDLSPFVIKNPTDLDYFVTRDRSGPMKKNVFVRFITVTHTITSLYPITPQSYDDWPFGIGYWNSCITHVMGVAYKNLARKSYFSQMCPSRSGFESYEHGAFRSD